MPAPTDRLGVWVNGTRLGTWSVQAGVHELAYDPAWTISPYGRALSLSLPFLPGNLPHRGEVVENYFDNLLPDSADIRRRLQSRFGRRTDGTFDLLAAIGRDCVGAVQLLPPDAVPGNVERVQAEPLSEAEVERLLNSVVSGGRDLGHADEDDFRISIAGAQEKTALLWHRGRWCRAVGSTPTTHILKLPLGLVGNLQADMKDSVENEWLCSRIVAGFGLPIADCKIEHFGGKKVLVVERFDRAWQGTRLIARLPQEDFCQALGIPSSRKYEKQGGPGMKEILRILALSENPPDAANFVKAQILFWALAATDGHGKNFSIFHLPGGRYRMTPLYDVLSTWPIIGKGRNQLSYHKAEMAMAVRSKNVHYELKGIRRQHWDVVARMAGLDNADGLVSDLLAVRDEIIGRVQSTLPKQFPAYVADRIFSGLERSLDALEAEPT